MPAKTSTAKGSPRTAVPKGQAALNEAWRVMHFALRAVIAEPDRILATRGLNRISNGMSAPGKTGAASDMGRDRLSSPVIRRPLIAT